MGNGRRSKVGVSHSFKRANALIGLRKATMPKLRAIDVPCSQGLAVSGLWSDFLSTVFRRFRRFWRAATGEGIASFQRLACVTVFTSAKNRENGRKRRETVSAARQTKADDRRTDEQLRPRFAADAEAPLE